jgi:tetratricopeptide (TPR) repeat protein
MTGPETHYRVQEGMLTALASGELAVSTCTPLVASLSRAVPCTGQLARKIPGAVGLVAWRGAHRLQATDSAKPMEEQAVCNARFVRRVFVGRKAELDTLRTGLQEAIGGRGRLLLIVGEPGIGKTRLAEQLATHAVQAGAVVRWGRCWDGGGAPAYWPWIQIIRAHLQQVDIKTVRAQLGAGAADIAQMVPEVAACLPDLEPPAPLGGEQARFRLFDSVGRFLTNAAAGCPQVFILDDLHAADVPSLLLLTFIAQDLPAMPVLIVGAYRDVEAAQDPGVDRTLAKLVREGHQLHLGGLDQTEIAGFIENAMGIKASSALVAAVHQTTEGNPLFIAAVVDLLARQGRLDQTGLPRWDKLGIPSEIRSAIRQRLDRLSPQAGQLLAQAAVIGREFDLALLARVAHIPPDAVEDAVAQALGWGILVESAQTLGHLAFSHDLVRRVLYTQLAFGQRAVLHRTVGLTLEKLYADSLDPPLAQLAHHFVCAAQGGDDDDIHKAAHYAQRAGDQAITQLAYEDAIGHYTQALGLLEAAGAGESARLELLIKLADAHTRTGDIPSGRQASRQAIELARRLYAPEQLTRAVLGLVSVITEVWTVDEAEMALLEEALNLVGDSNPGLRSMLLAQLGVELYWSEAGFRSGPLTVESLRLARHSGDTTALTHALDARHYTLWEPEHLAERTAIASELIRVAVQAGDKDMLLMGHRWRINDLVEQGDIAEADLELERFDRLAEEVRQPTARWFSLVVHTRRALLSGHFDEAERLAQAAYSSGSRLERRDALGIYALQMFLVLRERGLLAELESLLQRAAQRYRGRFLWRAALANVFCHLDRKDDARREFERLAADQFAHVPSAPERLLTLALLAEACVFLNDERHAGELHNRLFAYAGHHAIGGAVVSFGAVDRYLGLLAQTMGQYQRARGHFQAALEVNRRMGALPWTAHTQHEYAQLLLDHGEPKERPAALQLLSEALEGVNTLRMQLLADAITTRLETLGGTSRAGHPPSAMPSSSPLTGMFHRQGEYWAIAYYGRSFLLKNMKGLGYIARLLIEPDREHHALDLVRMEQPIENSTSARNGTHQAETMVIGFGDAGELLDRQAKTAYRVRLTELRQELDTATDPEHAIKLQTEIDFLTRQLATAMGLGGRNRKAASAAERARLNVTHRIKAAVRKIAVHDPHLGRHLDTSIRTGTFCSYRPDPAARTSWTL